MKLFAIIAVVLLSACASTEKPRPLHEVGSITIGPRNPDNFAKPTGNPGDDFVVTTYGDYSERQQKKVDPQWLKPTKPSVYMQLKAAKEQ